MTKGLDLASANDPTDSSTRASGSTTRNTAMASLHSRYASNFDVILYSIYSRKKTWRTESSLNKASPHNSTNSIIFFMQYMG